MKTCACIILVAVLGTLASVRVQAIPTTINGNNFLGAQGNEDHLPVEEWFRNVKHWLAGSELPGAWSGGGSDGARLTLENPGAIFGVNARSVTVLKDATGGVKEVIATYDETTSKKNQAALLAALQKNITVFTSGTASKKQPDGSQSFTGGGLVITLSGNGGVTARIVRS